MIDNIIASHTDMPPDKFTGGAIQVSISQKGLCTYSLILYFGFSTHRNPLSRSIAIRKEDVTIISKALIAKAEEQSVKNQPIILNLSDINTKKITNKEKNNDDIFNDWFEDVWTQYRTYIKQYRTQYGNKIKAMQVVKKAYISLKKTTGRDDDEVLHFIHDYIGTKLDGAYTINIDKWLFDDLDDFIQ